jgi:hypothetical protein
MTFAMRIPSNPLIWSFADHFKANCRVVKGAMTDDAKDQFAGMTVNERLCVAGLIETWDAAVRARDRNAMIATLRAVDIAAPENIVDTVLANPARYGF